MERKTIITRLLPLIFIFSFSVRLIYLYQVESLPFSGTLILDALDEDTWARSIAAGDWLGAEKGIFYRDPLYAYFLAITYSLFGHNLQAVTIMQALLDSSMCLLLFFVGARVFNPTVGLTASILAALYGPFVFHQGLIMKNSMTVFLLILFLLAMIHALEKQRFLPWILAGITLALTSMTRGNIILFVPAVIGFSLFYPSPLKMADIKNRLLPVSGLLVGLAVVMLPLATRNFIYGGAFAMSVPSSGINFYIGNNPAATGTHTPLPRVRTIPEKEREDARRIAVMESGRELSPSEVSDFWFKKAAGFATDNPSRFLWLMSRKFLLFWNYYEVPDVYNYYFYKKTSSLLYFLLTFGIIGPLGIAGMIISFKEWKMSRILSGLILIYMLSVLIFYITSRYRLPATLMLFPFSAFTLVRLTEHIRNGSYVKLLLTGLLIVVLAVPVNTSFLDGDKFLSQSHTLLGNIYHQKGEIDKAEREYTTALSLDSGNDGAANNLAYTYAEKGEHLPEALSLSRESLVKNPNSPDYQGTLAYIYMKMGKMLEAMKHINRALELDPGNKELKKQQAEIEGKL